jgi:hypothetical protein
MADEFQVTAVSSAMAAARREVDRGQRRIIGVTVSAPLFKDNNGLLEFVCNVRIGEDDEWRVVTDVLIAQEAQGIVTDENIPVTMERNEAGRLTIIARSVLHVAKDIRIRTYTYNELGFAFMSLVEFVDGAFRDGFGYTSDDPEDTDTTGTSQDCSFSVRRIEWGSTEFEYGTTVFGATVTEWTCT